MPLGYVRVVKVVSLRQMACLVTAIGVTAIGVTAIGGLLVALASLTVIPAARADELADLRANNERLQQRLDQIRRAGDPAERGSATSNGEAAGSFPRSFAIPGTTTSMRVSGSVSETFTYRSR
jgi:hypothetical protein